MDSLRLSGFGDALAALAIQMNQNTATDVASRGASVLAKALENPKETDSVRLSRLGSALAALAAHMDHNNVTSVAARSRPSLQSSIRDRKRNLWHCQTSFLGRFRLELAKVVKKKLKIERELRQFASR